MRKFQYLLTEPGKPDLRVTINPEGKGIAPGTMVWVKIGRAKYQPETADGDFAPYREIAKRIARDLGYTSITLWKITG